MPGIQYGIWGHFSSGVLMSGVLMSRNRDIVGRASNVVFGSTFRAAGHPILRLGPLSSRAGHPMLRLGQLPGAVLLESFFF